MRPTAPAANGGASARLSADVGFLVVGGAAIGWVWLIANVWSAGAAADLGTLGPGMAFFNRFTGIGDLPESVRAGLQVLCTIAPDKGWSLADFANALTMWLAMVLAMMLPSAAPVLTIAVSTAPHARTTAALLAVGYLSAWSIFAIGATALQGLLAEVNATHAAMAPMTDTLAATTLLSVGLYQFTPWKAGCLRRCRLPAPVYFAGTPTAGGIYRRGLQLGIDCLGCCWAFMLAMFAVGVMNLLWIAGLGAVMALEKCARGRSLSWLIGLGLIAIGFGLLTASPAGVRLLGAL